MEEDSKNYIIAKTREFREKLRDYVDVTRVSKKEVVVQSNKKNVAVLMSFERWIELKRKAGESVDDILKEASTHRRLSVDNEPSMCLAALNQTI